MEKILLIPRPVSVIYEAGTCALKRKIDILTPPAADFDDLSAAFSLKEFLHQRAGVNADLSKRLSIAPADSAIIMARADRDGAWLRENSLAAQMPELKPQGYFLRIARDGILLVGADAPGLFYAVLTLNQIIDQAEKTLPAMTIVDYPAILARGVMLDVSRGKVPTLDDLLELVERLAAWKINQFQLYVEHTFAFPSHPKIGKGYDPLTPEDMIVLDEACARRHIDFVPNLQSFGHQGHMLRLREYGHLAETDHKWTLSPAEPGTYTLLDELYRDFLPNFRSPNFNVDSDETWDLGKGKSAALAKERGVGRVYLAHILKLRDLSAKYGRKMMFWGDIILHFPELISDIPDDVTVLQWEYGPRPSEESVRRFAEAGKKFYVCPGVNTWNAFFPRQDDARKNISALALYGARYGAAGLLNTDWGDGGHYNFQGLSMYGYAFGAAESWQPGSTDDFDSAFGLLFFGKNGAQVMEAMRELERVHEPIEGFRVSDVTDFHLGFLTGRPFRERLTLEVACKIIDYASRGLELLRKLRSDTREPLVLEEIRLAAAQDLFYGQKAQAAVRFHAKFREVVKKHDIDAFEELAKDTRAEIKRLAAIYEKNIPENFAALWLARAREAGLVEMLEWQEDVVADYRATAEWLKKAVRQARKTGEIPPLPEISDDWQPLRWKMQMGGEM